MVLDVQAAAANAVVDQIMFVIMSTGHVRTAVIEGITDSNV